MPPISTDFDDELSALLTSAVETHGRAATSRVASCFYSLRIRTAQDIAKHTRYEFARIPNCGRKSLDLIDVIAEEAGVLLEDGGPEFRLVERRPQTPSLYEDALARFKQAFNSGTGIAMTATEVAAIGSLLLLAAQVRR